MTPVERIEYMLNMEARVPQKDGAGIYVANGVDSAVKRKTLQECLKILKSTDERQEPIL